MLYTAQQSSTVDDNGNIDSDDSEMAKRYTASRIIDTVRRVYNRHAERAGLEQKDLDEDLIVYWLAHVLCCVVMSISLLTRCEVPDELAKMKIAV
jgi:hypothetical protein